MAEKQHTDFGDNRGDVALALPADWARTRIAGDPNFTLGTVGHENGVPDAYKTDRPKDRHQFRWIDPRDQNERSIARTKHYEMVSNTNWTKNPHLWDWNGEGFVEFNGQLLWARDEVYYIDENEQGDKRRKERDRSSSMTSEEEALLKKLIARGSIVEDERGRPLVPLSRK